MPPRTMPDISGALVESPDSLCQTARTKVNGGLIRRIYKRIFPSNLRYLYQKRKLHRIRCKKIPYRGKIKNYSSANNNCRVSSFLYTEYNFKLSNFRSSFL